MTITEVAPSGVSAGLDQLLDASLRSLDLTDTEYELAVSRYRGVGRAMDDHWSSSPGENVVSPQGSFLLGTVTRPVGREDEVDIDIVVNKDVLKSSVTQIELKNDVGDGLRKYAGGVAARPALDESDRCWTLQWNGMHMDVLPAIPDTASASGTGLFITDRALRNWQYSDPAGYAAWFRRRMATDFLQKEAVLAKRLQVDEVPSWKVKTSLQQTVQALKRHRDLYFAENLDNRPSSIILTTLAGLAYRGGGTLYDVLREVTGGMSQHLQRVDGTWFLPNPVQAQENFADYWEIEPARADRFFEWLEVAMDDFGAFAHGGGLNIAVTRLQKAFGARAGDAAARSMSEELFTARTTGALKMAGGTGLLTVASVGATATSATAANSRRVGDHAFRGGTKQ